MPLIPYEPFRHLDNMRRELDRFIPEDWSLLRGDFAKSLGNISIDVHETDQEVVAKCDIPGLEKREDVSIDIDNNMLTIGGTLNRVSESKDERMHRQERYTGRFHRSIGLPANVSAEGVTAVYKNGVLEVRMPKLKGDAKKRIEVQFH